MKLLLMIFFFLMHLSILDAQSAKRFKICLAAFYNLENLYDTINNPIIHDEEFTPSGSKKYSKVVYTDKLNHLSEVIASMGLDKTKDGIALLGVAEVENDTVLRDLVANPLLKKRNYQFVHYDSKDNRGIDVAFLYNPKYFVLESSRPIPVTIISGGTSKSFASRDILLVTGFLDGERINVLVNHWPSKKGGEDQSSISRNFAAKICKDAIIEIQRISPNAKILVMGDFNDNPDSWAIQHILGTVDDIKKVKSGDIFNPWLTLYNDGYGSLANRDSWSLFDQILLTGTWLNNNGVGFYFYKAVVYNPNFMTENRGKYKGYPLRTWSGNQYRGGFSDHFPTYLMLIKQIK